MDGLVEPPSTVGGIRALFEYVAKLDADVTGDLAE